MRHTPKSYELASRVWIIVVLQPHPGQILCQYGGVFLRKKYFSTMRIDRQRKKASQVCATSFQYCQYADRCLSSNTSNNRCWISAMNRDIRVDRHVGNTTQVDSIIQSEPCTRAPWTTAKPVPKVSSPSGLQPLSRTLGRLLLWHCTLLE